MIRSRHSSLIDRTNRSAYAFAFGARYGVWTIRIPPSRRHSRTGPRHFVSRSQIRMRHVSASAMVSVRPTWRMNASSSCDVDPRIGTRRDAKWITNTAYIVTKPRRVQTSVRGAPRVGPFAGSELSVPSQQRIRRHDRGALPQYPPAHPKRPRSKPSAVVIGEAQTLATQLRAQDA